MIQIKRALVSVSDKAGVVDFCRVLAGFGVEILSTGGTAAALRQANIPVRDVSDYTGFPEILDGRVKTLHPKVHAGLLAVRANKQHTEALRQLDIGLIDMVVVNLYPFEKTVSKPGVSAEEAIENIDIGGPSMLRSAAKNFRFVAVVSDPAQYAQVAGELQETKGRLSEQTCARLGREVFRKTAQYDAAIHAYLAGTAGAETAAAPAAFPQTLQMNFAKIQDLRYGENNHQKAAFYADARHALQGGLTGLKQLWGKELSFNNILDLNAAVAIVKEFRHPAVVFVKHNNPCGVAEDASIHKAYTNAWKCDTLSAFGGIVGINRPVDLKLAKLIASSGFLECIICPGFSAEAAEVLKAKKNLRLIELPTMLEQCKQLDIKRVSGGILVQDEDVQTLSLEQVKVVTKKKPTRKQLESLVFGWKVAKHVKSNAIVLCRGSKTVGIGAGQMSRVESVVIAGRKAGAASRASCLASDGFFPKDDNVALAAKLGVKAIIQPGGSIADEQIIAACNKRGIAMVFTGIRHFRH